MKRLTKGEFILKAKELHGNKYDYSKVEYVNANTEVCIICPEHGEFWQTPKNHLRTKGCEKCRTQNRINSKTMSTEQFIEKACKIHGNKYDYSKTIYKGYSKKVCIICPTHGEFLQIANNHINGEGCPKCKNEKLRKDRAMSLLNFIERAKEIHKDKYDYSKVEYVNTNKKVCIICPIHGEFWQIPNQHLSGSGCIKCSYEKRAKNRSLTNEEFIKKAHIVHNNFYIYDKVNYKNAHTKVIITCPLHGDFTQTPNDHLNGGNCPVCNIRSILERKVEKFLIDNNINYIKQKTFNWLKYKKNLKLDFYLPEYNKAIECQGKQHFYYENTFYKDINDYEEGIKRDIKKYSLCKEHNIDIVYFFNKEYMNEFYKDKLYVNDLAQLLSFI